METVKTLGKIIVLFVTVGLLTVSCSKGGDGPYNGPVIPGAKGEPKEIKFYDLYARKDGVTVRYYKNAKYETSEGPITEKFLLFQEKDGPVRELTATSQKDTLINGTNHHLYVYEIRGMKENIPFSFTYRYRWQKTTTESIPFMSKERYNGRTCMGILPVIYVSPDGSPDADGLTWGTAVDRIQTAYDILYDLAYEANPYYPQEDKVFKGEIDRDSLWNRFQWEIRVKEGVYMAGEAEKEYKSKENVRYTGGFAGNETDANPHGSVKSIIDGGGTMPLYRGNGHFKNFIFRNGKGVKADAGRYYSYSPIIISLAEFEDCEFRNNVNPATSPWPFPQGDGGAVCIMNRGEGKDYIVTNDNLVENYPATVFKNCIFENNQCVENGSGGAVAMMEFNRVIFDACNFINNKAEISGAINALMNNQIELYDCNFNGNVAHAGSVLYCAYFKVISKDCIFSKNENKFYKVVDEPTNEDDGVIMVDSEAHWVDLGGNTFKDNIGKDVSFLPL